MSRLALFLAALAVFAVLAGCGGSGKTEAGKTQARDADAHTVCVTHDPLRVFAERIGGGQIKVVFPHTGDEDPEFWQPDDAALQAYQHADLILLNGAGYDKWVTRASLSESKLVDTAQAFKAEFIPLSAAVTHSHGPEGEHSHTGFIGITWLDPLQAKHQARAAYDALVKRWPDHAADFKPGFEALIRDLDALHAAWAELMQDYTGAPVVGSHPVFDYLARRYQWNYRAVHFEPHEMPDDKALQDLRALLKQHPAKYMVWEAEPKPEIAKRLKDEFGLEVAVCYPGGLLSGKDYFELMKENIERLKPVFAKASP